jgi:hypothetical protein
VEAELSDEELEELEALLDELEEEESDFEEAEENEETLASEFDELDDTLVPVSFVPVETFVFDEALPLLSPHEANKVMGSAMSQMILLSIQKSSSHTIKGKRIIHYRQKDKENATSIPFWVRWRSRRFTKSSHACSAQDTSGLSS